MVYVHTMEANESAGRNSRDRDRDQTGPDSSKRLRVSPEALRRRASDTRTPTALRVSYETRKISRASGVTASVALILVAVVGVL